MIEARMDGTQLYCALCNYLQDVIANAHMVIEGTSLCAEHARDVIHKADYIWWWSDGSFSLTETINHWQGAS